jgi:SagB-type dehydrogenase family enzyme
MKSNPLNIGRPTPDELFSPMEVYHENSKLGPNNEELFQKIATVNSSPHIRTVISRPFRSYPGCPHVDLPTELAPMTRSLENILTKRRSAHHFSATPTQMDELARILLLGDGIVSRMTSDDGAEFLLRTAPSGGGLYPIETFCFVFNVAGVPSGAYFYNTQKHRLERLAAEDFRPRLSAATNLSAEVESAGFCIALSAVLPRSSFKYGQRAYRFALLEAGHIAQNLLLAAEGLDLGGLPIGGFFDDDINALLNLDGCQEFVVYLLLIGNKSREEQIAGG